MKKSMKRLVCLFLTLVTVLPVLLSIPFTASAATDPYRVIATSAGASIGYRGKNYATGATNANQKFDLSAGFLLQQGTDLYWGTCGDSGKKSPSVGTSYSSLQQLASTFRDGYNNWGGGTHGAHYVTGEQNGGSMWGRSMTVSTQLVFLCYYYANKHLKDEFSSFDPSTNTDLMEAIAIAYRYEWDTRLIMYRTGSWDGKSWTNYAVSTWKEDTTHFNGLNYVTGNGISTARAKAIVEAANAILKYAMKDEDKVADNIKKTSSTMWTYTLSDGQTCSLQLASGEERAEKPGYYYQSSFLYSPFEMREEYYSLKVQKYDENNRPLAGARFNLYQKDRSGTYKYYGYRTSGSDGIAEWKNELPAGDYYVQEYSAPAGYAVDTTKYYRTLGGTSDNQTAPVTVRDPKPTGSWTPDVTKKLIGRNLKKDEFTFTLSENGKVLQTVKNLANGSVPFSAVKYTYEDRGTHTYTIRETKGTDGTVYYDSHTVTYTVEVSYSGSGSALKVKVVSVVGSTEFNNPVPTGSWTPEVTKLYDGHEPGEKKFEFQLWQNSTSIAKGGVLLQTKTNNPDGSIPFTAIQYDASDIGKTYTYYVLESSNSVSNDFVKDGHIIKYEVTVNYSGSGLTLYPHEERSGNPTFDNQPWNSKYGAVGIKKVDENGVALEGVIFDVYTIAWENAHSGYTGKWDDGTLMLPGISMPSGYASPNNISYSGTIYTNEQGEAIIYSLPRKSDSLAYYNDLAQNRINNNDDTFNIPLQDFAGGNIYFVFVERQSKPGYKIDTNYYMVQITTAGQVNWANDGIPVVNPHEGISWLPEATKLFDGQEPGDKQFDFELREGSTTGTVLQSVKNLSDGTIPFERIWFSEADIGKKFTYYVLESSASVPGEFIKDDHVIKYEVTVSRSSSGTDLDVDVQITGDTTFDNTDWNYGAIGIRKVDEKGEPLSGARFHVYGSDMAVVLATITTDTNGVATYGVNVEGYYMLQPGAKFYLQESAAPTGYVIDTTIYEVTVVEDQLVWANDGEPVVNYPEGTVDWTPKVNKTLTGARLEEGMFYFQFEDQLVANSADGSVVFETITYTLDDAGKSFTYHITEVDCNPDLVDFDYVPILSDGLYIRVTVRQQNGGKDLSLEWQLSTDGSTWSSAITNEEELNRKLASDYAFENRAVATFTPKAQKVYEGGTLYGGDFTFILEENGTELERVTNSADGSVVFSSIEYVAGSKAPTKRTFTIRELPGDDPNIEYDDTVYTFTVEFRVTGDSIDVIMTPAATDAVFTFTNYRVSAVWAPSVKKILKGETLEEGQFTFELCRDGVLIEEATNNEEGWVSFSEIEFKKENVGTYTYVVTEKKGANGYTYSEGSAIFSVTVSYDSVLHEVNVSSEVSGSIEFTNYKNGAIGIKKVDASGEPLSGVTFGVYTDSGCTVKDIEIITGADGYAYYGKTSDTEYSLVPGTEYYFKEISVKDATYAPVDTVYPVTVVEGTITYANSGSGVVNYKPTGSWTPSAQKLLEGETLKAEEFAFDLLDESDGVLQTARNDADGKIIFQPIQYDYTDVDKTYTYRIKEVVGTEPSIRYSDNVLEYSVKITYSGTGNALTVTPTLSSGDETFINEFVPEVTWTPVADKVLIGKDLTENAFAFTLSDETGVLQTKQNLADGTIPFDELTFYLADEGTHTFTIREVAGDDPTISYDSHVLTYTVTVSYNSDKRELTVTEEHSGSTTFTNTHYGKIEVLKVDTDGNSCAGAEFLLEWSEDGTVWTPVTYSATLVKGGCTSAGVTDGKLMTDEDGIARFYGLNPELTYRLTETKAPEGMQLLSGYAFVGMLPTDKDLTVSLRIVNAPEFVLPPTGDEGFGYLMIALPLLCCCGAMLWIYGYNKRKRS